MSGDERAWGDGPDDTVDADDTVEVVEIDGEIVEVVETVEVVDVVVEPDGSAGSAGSAGSEGSEDDQDGDAADEADRASDAAIDALDDGSALTGGVPVQDDVPGSDVLFTLSSREHFAALDDPEATGDARVDAAASRLAELPELPTADHVDVYDDVHRRLQDALADAEVT